MTRYTLGFLFNASLSKVLLIHKLTPEWQKGKVNGLGGKFEGSEDCYDCIAREVEEETSLKTTPSDWKKVGELHSSKWRVEVLACIYKGKEIDAKSVEAQKVEWFSVEELPNNCMVNLFWLIPLCKDAIENNDIKLFLTEYLI